MSASKSTAEHAQDLRAAFKSKGWNARKVSVRVEYYSCGSSIHVTIRDLSIPLADVEAIASSAESISRCSTTGEILSGGNTFVHVKYDSRAAAASVP
jgi:hypothetical protein